MDTYDLDAPAPADPGPDAEAAHGHRWARRWPAVVAVLTLIVAGPVVVDQHRRDQEISRLVDRVRAAQSSLRYTDGLVLSSVAYTSPQLTSDRVPERVRAGLRRIVQDTAGRRIGPLREHRAAVATVEVRPWHKVLRRARDAYLAYLDERIAVLTRLAGDLRVLYRPQPTSARLLAAARAALRAAAPDGPARALLIDPNRR